MRRFSLLAVLWAASLSSISVGRSDDLALPGGPGKETVEAVCSVCHALNRLRAGYTPSGWHTVVRMMLNFGAPIPQDQVATVTDYLIRSFPERPRPAAVLISGPADVTITEWPVPTPGSRPHDPLGTKDGAIWYTGQLANALGRLDPATGQFREYKLNPQTGPHGLAEDGNGNIWFTGNFAGIIGRLDPRSGAVVEHKLPDPAARDTHSLAFDQRGILWFTVQQANMLGRLDPATGDVRLIKSPTPSSRPYGIQVNSKGVPFVCEFGANKILSIDPETMQLREYTLPDPQARPRRLAIDGDDVVWYTDFARGFLGRLDPATGHVTEWASPGGPKSEPYGIAFAKGAIWYSESSTTPNTIVRFDPVTQQFQTWPIPGGGDIVRNMAVTRDGNVALANSLVNEVGLVAIK